MRLLFQPLTGDRLLNLAWVIHGRILTEGSEACPVLTMEEAERFAEGYYAGQQEMDDDTRRIEKATILGQVRTARVCETFADVVANMLEATAPPDDLDMQGMEMRGYEDSLYSAAQLYRKDEPTRAVLHFLDQALGWFREGVAQGKATPEQAMKLFRETVKIGVPLDMDEMVQLICRPDAVQCEMDSLRFQPCAREGCCLHSPHGDIMRGTRALHKLTTVAEAVPTLMAMVEDGYCTTQPARSILRQVVEAGIPFDEEEKGHRIADYYGQHPEAKDAEREVLRGAASRLMDALAESPIGVLLGDARDALRRLCKTTGIGDAPAPAQPPAEAVPPSEEAVPPAATEVTEAAEARADTLADGREGAPDAPTEGADAPNGTAKGPTAPTE